MIEHHESRIVPYTAELMYSIVADVVRYPEFLPWVIGLRILSDGQDRKTAEMMVGYGALRERYTSDIALDPLAMAISVTQTKGPFKILQNHWRFDPQPQGCEIHFSIKFEFKSRLLAKLAGAKFEKAMLRMTEAFEARAAALSQAPG